MLFYCKSTFIPGYQYLWIREKKKHIFVDFWICGFEIFSIYPSKGISFSLGTKFSGFAYPWKPGKLVPTNNSTFTVVLAKYWYWIIQHLSTIIRAKNVERIILIFDQKSLYFRVLETQMRNCISHYWKNQVEITFFSKSHIRALRLTNTYVWNLIHLLHVHGSEKFLGKGGRGSDLNIYEWEGILGLNF